MLGVIRIPARRFFDRLNYRFSGFQEFINEFFEGNKISAKYTFVLCSAVYYTNPSIYTTLDFYEFDVYEPFPIK